MNYFALGQQYSTQGYSMHELNTTFATISNLQMQLLCAQNSLMAFKEENETLKAILTGLQDQLEKATQHSDSKSGQDSETTCVLTEGSIEIESKKNKTPLDEKNVSSFPTKQEEVVFHETQSTIPYESSIDDEKDSDFPSPGLNLNFEEDNDCEEEFLNGRVPIKRKNGFKELKTDSSRKKNGFTKSQRSRAKHLWIAYGRKILEYSLCNSHGQFRKKIKECNKLTSKKGYSESFLMRSHDEEAEKEFKKEFGKLALEFFEKEVESAFLNSNYRNELISQKDKVENWIRILIKEH